MKILNLNYFMMWIKNSVLLALGEKYFLYVIGSIFLLGIVGKCIVWANYRRLIKGAENINRADSAVLRQIKMRIDSVKEVNGIIVSPAVLIDRQLNRCHILKISINTMDFLIHWCTTIILAWGTLSFIAGEEVTNMVIAGGVSLVLEWINLCFGTGRLRDELKIILIDYIENNNVEKKRTLEEPLSEVGSADEEHRRKEIILNQVIGEYLQ